MKNGLKRIVAMLCAVAMIAGGCFVTGGNTTKASDITETKEWVVASQVGDITSTADHVGEIYRRMSNLNIQLNAEKTKDCYMLYMKINLRGESAVAGMKNTYVELANNGDGDGEICWLPAYWNQHGIKLQTGVNEVYLPLDKMVDANATSKENFSVIKEVKHFRIHTNGVSGDYTGVILDEVKILDVSHVVQEYPNGATAGTAPEVSSVPEGYVFAGWYTNENCTSRLEGTTTNIAYAKFVNEKVLGVKAQYATRDVQTEWNLFSGGKDITTDPLSGKVYYESNSYNVQLDETRDYYVLYLKVNLADENAITSLKGAIVEIANGNADQGELSWSLADRKFQTGVNELYLAFSRAVDTTKNYEAFNIEKVIKHFRIYNIAKTDCSGVVLNEAKILKSVPEVLITNCDTTEGLTLSKGTAMNTIGRYKEGSGAYIHNVAEQVVSNFTLSTPINLTQYLDGSLYVDLYVENTSKIYKNMIVELGNAANQTYRWVLPKAYLSNGWNELCLSLEKATLVGSAVDNTQIDFFRILQNTLASGTSDSYTAMTTIVDNIRVDRAQAGLVIANCDSSYGLTLSKGTPMNTIGRYKEGSGAYIHEVAEQVITNFTLGTSLDLTQYKDGSLYFDFYVNDRNKIYKNLIVEFGNDTTNRYRWVVPKAYLSSGWNEICLSLTNTPLGTLNITQMDMFRVYQQGLATGTSDSYTAMTTIVDNVRVKNTQDGKMFSSCDSVDGVTLSTGVLTTDNEQGRYKEGSRAYVLADSDVNVRVNFTLNTSVDLSEYLDGSVYADVYVNDWNAINGNLIVEIGHNPSNTYYWVIPKAYLSSGWNQLCLAFEHATKLGTVDAKTVNTFRIRQNSSGTFTKMTTIVDNIRVEKPHSNEVIIKKYADLRFVTTVDSLYYQNVGFKIEVGQKYIEPNYTEVYDTLYGVSNENETLTFKPYVFAAESNYFNTHTLANIPDTDFDKEIKVTPFWTTQDGTKVYGTEPVTYTVNSLMQASAVKKTDLRVVMSSDIHYTSLVDCYNGSGETAAKARMQHWVDSIKKEHAKDPIDLLVLNGDLSLDYWDDIRQSINNWTGGESGMTKAFIDSYLSQLPKEIAVWVMPGNHELYTDTQWNEITGNARQGYIVKDNNLFLFMDNYSGDLASKTQTSEATYTATNTAYIQEMMDANPDCDVYIISHYFDRTQEGNLETLLASDTSERIKGLFEGHTHGSKVFEWSNRSIARTGNFSYTFDTEGTDKPFWGFRELIITEDSAYSQYISVAGITGDEKTASYIRKTTDSVWYY